jgi:hypothetical protein
LSVATPATPEVAGAIRANKDFNKGLDHGEVLFPTPMIISGAAIAVAYRRPREVGTDRCRESDLLFDFAS